MASRLPSSYSRNMDQDEVFTVEERKSYSQVLEIISKLSHNPNVTYNTSLQVPDTLILQAGQIQQWFYTDKFSVSHKGKLKTRLRTAMTWDNFTTLARTHRVDRNNLAMVRITKGTRSSYHLLKDNHIDTLLAPSYNRGQWECVYEYIPHKVTDTQKGALYVVVYRRSKKPELEIMRANFANKEGLLYDLEAAEHEESRKKLQAHFFISSKYRTQGTTAYQQNFYHAFLENEKSRAASINIQMENAARAVISMIESRREMVTSTQKVKKMKIEFLRDSNGLVWMLYIRELVVFISERTEQQRKETRVKLATMLTQESCSAKKYCNVPVDDSSAGPDDQGKCQPKRVTLKDILLDDIECDRLPEPQDLETNPLALSQRKCNLHSVANIQSLISVYPHLRPSNYYSQRTVCTTCFLVYTKLALERSKRTMNTPVTERGMLLTGDSPRLSKPMTITRMTSPILTPTLSGLSLTYRPQTVAKSYEGLIRLNRKLDKFQKRVEAKKEQSVKELRNLYCPYLGSGHEETSRLFRLEPDRVQRLLHPPEPSEDFK